MTGREVFICSGLTFIPRGSVAGGWGRVGRWNVVVMRCEGWPP